MMNRNRSGLLRTAALAGAMALAGCGGGGGGDDGSEGSTETGMGTLQLSLTDRPACYEQVNVTVERIRIHRSSTADEGDGGWKELVLRAPRRVDLTKLTNGHLEDLGRLRLPAGSYKHVRLVLAANTPAAPLANSVKPVGGDEVPLKTPSGQQSGLKLNNLDLVVPAGRVAHLVLDFDACKSVVKAGKSGQYLLKPVLTATAVLTDVGQKVKGCVASSPLPLLLPRTEVSLQRRGVPVKATVPHADGCFVLYPVRPGTYDLVATSPGHATAVITGVPVTLDGPTTVSTKQLPIELPTSPISGVAAGSVSPTTAVVRALQTLTGGPTVEVQRADVDADDGSFVMTLPAGAPWVTSYLRIDPLQLPASLGFEPDTAAAGYYTVQAKIPGSVKTEDIDVTQPVPPLFFDFD